MRRKFVEKHFNLHIYKVDSSHVPIFQINSEITNLCLFDQIFSSDKKRYIQLHIDLNIYRSRSQS